MARVVSRDKSMAQIQLDSGERVLISCTQTEIAIFKLTFFGFIPSTKIWKGDTNSFLDKVYSTGGHTLFALDPVQYLIDRVMGFSSISEIRNKFTT